MYKSFHRLFQKNIIKLHARFCNSNIQIFSYGSILTFRMPGLWNSQFCLSHIFKCISHILAFTQMYLLIFVFLTIRVSQFYKIPVLSFLVLSLLVGCSQFCLSQLYVVTLKLGHSHVSEAALASVLMKVHFVLFVLKFASVGKRDYSGQQRLAWLALLNSI